MKPILISGQVTYESSLKVDGFPVPYNQLNFTFFGINSLTAGVGINIGAALKTFGRPVKLLGMVGKDLLGDLVLGDIKARGLETSGILRTLETTTQSIILYDPNGKQQIFNDMKEIQDLRYPADLGRSALETCEAAVLCNINFSRSLLSEAKALGKTIFTDVHLLSDPEDTYNKEFMTAADVLFLSNEHVKGREREFVGELSRRYNNSLIIMGMGSQGAMLWDRSTGEFWHQGAIDSRPVVNTIGAGDALFSCFLDGYLKKMDPKSALRRACAFAGYKIGASGAALGFPSEEELGKILA